MKKTKDLWYYFQGWFRYHLYYNGLKCLIRKHIKEQIDMRIFSMNEECLNSGSCIKCGCSTTALQMCNKPCEGECYPKMLNWQDWNFMKHSGMLRIGDKKFVEGDWWEITKMNKFRKMNRYG